MTLETREQRLGVHPGLDGGSGHQDPRGIRTGERSERRRSRRTIVVESPERTRRINFLRGVKVKTVRNIGEDKINRKFIIMVTGFNEINVNR